MTPDDFFGLAQRSGETPRATVLRFVDFFARHAERWTHDDTDALEAAAMAHAAYHLRVAADALRDAERISAPATPRNDGVPRDDESLIAGGRAVTCPACCPLRHIHADKNPPHHVDCPKYVPPLARDRGPVK